MLQHIRNCRARRLGISSSLLLLMAVCLFIGGCGSGVSGTYQDQNGIYTIEFKSGGRAYVSTFAGTVETDYRVDGDRVILGAAAGNMVFTIDSDGTLSGGPLGMKLKKKDS